LTNLYKTIHGLFDESTRTIIEGIREGAGDIFNSTFYNSTLSLALVGFGFLIAFRKIDAEETARKFLWALFMFSLSSLLMVNDDYYDYFISLVNIPRDVFIEVVSKMVVDMNSSAGLEDIIDKLQYSVYLVTNSLFDKGSMTNLVPYIYGGIVWLSGSFLILVTLLNTVFSIFLSNIIISLLPFVIPTLVFKKTESVFFAWIKLYISISLYAPFTILFGLVSVHVATYTMSVAPAIQNDFGANVGEIIGLVIAQCLIAIGVFKIPNIVNQLIGSSNEGGSLTSGVGTVSAGGAIMSTFAKFTGLNILGKGAAKGLTNYAKNMNGSSIRKSGIDSVKFS